MDGKVYPIYSKSAYVKFGERLHDKGGSRRFLVIKSQDFDIDLTVERFQKGEIPADYRILD